MAAAVAEGEDGDLALALQLQELWEAEDGEGVTSAQPPAVPEPLRPLSVVDEAWELLDPSPDVRGLFVQLNEALFWGRLAAVEVAWSPRMTLYGRGGGWEPRAGPCPAGRGRAGHPSVPAAGFGGSRVRAAGVRRRVPECCPLCSLNWGVGLLEA